MRHAPIKLINAFAAAVRRLNEQHSYADTEHILGIFAEAIATEYTEGNPH